MGRRFRSGVILSYILADQNQDLEVTVQIRDTLEYIRSRDPLVLSSGDDHVSRACEAVGSKASTSTFCSTRLFHGHRSELAKPVNLAGNALALSIYWGLYPLLKSLLDEGVADDDQSIFGEPFLLAIQQRDTRILSIYLANTSGSRVAFPRSLTSFHANEWKTCIILAIKNGTPEALDLVVEAALKSGKLSEKHDTLEYDAPPNRRSKFNRLQTSILAMAVYVDRLDMVKKAIDNGAAVNGKDCRIVNEAIRKKSWPLVHLLITRGARVKIEKKRLDHNQMLFRKAIEDDQMAVVEHCLDHGLLGRPSNIRKPMGYCYPLVKAVELARHRIIRMLLDRGYNLETQPGLCEELIQSSVNYEDKEMESMLWEIYDGGKEVIVVED